MKNNDYQVVKVFLADSSSPVLPVASKKLQNI